MRREERRETSTFVCVPEREREGPVHPALSPMLALHGLANTVFVIRKGEGCGIVQDLVLGWIL